MGAFRIMLLAGIATLAVGGGSLAQTGPGPSMEDFLKADNDSANWVLPAHNYSANRQVEESEIGPRYGSGHLGAAGDLCIEWGALRVGRVRRSRRHERAGAEEDHRTERADFVRFR